VPSFTLLAQSILSGLFVGGLYGLLGLGLSLSWGLLRLINLAHFALAFLGAYLTYTLSTAFGLDPLWSLLLVPPAFFGLGVLGQLLFARFGVTQFGSLLVTFGLTVMIESVIQWVWTADYRRLEAASWTGSWRVGPLFVPRAELLAVLAAATLAGLSWVWLRYTWTGKGLRACAEDPEIAAAFGVNGRRLALLLSGLGAAFAGVAGAFVALIYTLAPAQIYAWIGVVFAVVILGGLGNPLGPLVAGMVIGVTEAVTMALTAPAWAPLVSFSLLILVLLLRPDRV
jgi:branched-chain amino acid transport system permease protein